MKYRSILLFGAPGSGKGTQGAILGKRPSLVHLACGDVFRSLDRESELGKLFTKYTAGGGLVPDELTVELWRDTVSKMIAAGRFDPATQILLLDGIPRTEHQSVLMQDDIDVVAIVHLFINDVSQLMARLQARAAKENRVDDTNIEVIRYRLDVYDEQTRPVLARYPVGKIARVNATQPPEQVTADILRALGDIKWAL
ncbi:MAG TPA: nucleoside monophosphate kinase [Tepidisphaeraceae bacterium]|nr:nucleoside monophosphate kinase [Tepidisphaeraceae bacterium]